MARLNYANRKSDGLKLAHIVAKDLRKKAVSSQSKGDNSPIELNLEGKAIGDDGVQMIVTALIEVLQTAHAGQRQSCQLEELRLTKNNITALGLRTLTSAIRLAGGWLADLDLSHNMISVQTAEECDAFEDFLDAFKDCKVLRRLDLSANDLSKTHAFEIMSRVYFRHAAYGPVSGMQPNARDEKLQERVSNVVSETAALSITGEAPTSDLHDLYGLQKIPYIVLTDVNMDDAGCFQLSYILPRHLAPEHLLQPLKAGPARAQLEDYDSTSGCSGIIYSKEKLSQYGARLLADCETQRADLDATEEKDDRLDGPMRTPPPKQCQAPSPPSALTAMIGPRHKHGTPRRRGSMVSGDSGKTSTFERRKVSAFDPESTRWKLQRETIELHGLNSVQLWSTAFRLLVTARAVLPSLAELDGPLVSAVSGIHKSTSFLHKENIKQHDDFAAWRGRVDSARSSTRGATPESATIMLPMKVWRRILSYAVDRAEILSDRQLDNVFEYATKRSTITAELDNLRNPESNQKWMILEGMGCLAYEMPL